MKIVTTRDGVAIEWTQFIEERNPKLPRIQGLK
jgi:hypothetical protein